MRVMVINSSIALRMVVIRILAGAVFLNAVFLVSVTLLRPLADDLPTGSLVAAPAPWLEKPVDTSLSTASESPKPEIRRHNYSRKLAGPFPAETMRVIDGDTAEMRVTIWLGQEIITKVRLRDIDAPELRAKCLDELKKAEAAREALTRMLAQDAVFLTEVGYDKYGTRVVAKIVNAVGTDIGATLVEQKFARPYGGGKRQTWCDLAKN